MTDTEVIEFLVIALARTRGVPESVIWWELGRQRPQSVLGWFTKR